MENNLINDLENFVKTEDITYNDVINIIFDNNNYYENSDELRDIFKSIFGEFEVVINNEIDLQDLETAYYIIYFKQFNQHVKFYGYNNSYEGTEFDFIKLTQPIQKTITVWT